MFWRCIFVVLFLYISGNPSVSMVLSAFSHYNFWHIAANMYVLWSFASISLSLFGREQWLAVYVSSGVCVCEILYFNYVCVAFNKGYWYRNYSRLWNSSSSVAQISCQQKMICIHMHISHLNVMLEYHSQFIDVKTMRLDWNQIPVQTAILCFIQLNSTLYFTWLKM